MLPLVQQKYTSDQQFQWSQLNSAFTEQIHRAEQGHIPSQAALGGLYYWGARGVPRDHVRALKYFDSAAVGGDNGARCAAAVSNET